MTWSPCPSIHQTFVHAVSHGDWRTCREMIEKEQENAERQFQRRYRSHTTRRIDTARDAQVEAVKCLVNYRKPVSNVDARPCGLLVIKGTPTWRRSC